MVFFRGLVKREEKFEVHPESGVQYINVGLSPALMGPMGPMQCLTNEIEACPIAMYQKL